MTALLHFRERGRSPEQTRTSDPVVLYGWYDISRRDELEFALNRIKTGAVVVLDLTKVQHIDCASPGMVLKKLARWREKPPNVELRLDNVGANIHKVIELLQLDEAVNCSSSPREANCDRVSSALASWHIWLRLRGLQRLVDSPAGPRRNVTVGKALVRSAQLTRGVSERCNDPNRSLQLFMR